MFQFAENAKKRAFFERLIIDSFFSIYFFFVLFMPPILHLSTMYIVMAINICLLFVVFFFSGTISIPKRLIPFLLSFVPFLAYFFSMQLIHAVADEGHRSAYVTMIKMNIVLFMFFYLLVVTIIQLIRFFHLKISDLIRYFFIASLLQLICVLLAFMIPAIKAVFIALIVKNSNSEIIQNAIAKEGLKRCFGFAENLFDSFGYIISLLISFILLEGIEKHKVKYIISAFIMLFMPLLNTRTGLLLSFVGFLIIGGFYLNPKMFAIMLAVTPLVVIIAIAVFNKLPRTTTDWVLKGVEDTSGLLNDENVNSGTYSEIFGRDMVFPDNLIFGAGSSPEKITNYRGIDSGYVQCLWRYGIVGSVLLFGAYIFNFGKAFFSSKEKRYRCMIIIDFVLFFIYLFKLYSISNYGAVILNLGIPAAIIYVSHEENRSLLKGNKKIILNFNS